jgi:hypothetical protein
MVIIYGTGFFIYVGILSVLKTIKFAMRYMEGIMLRDHLCEIISMNGHAPLENKCDNTEDSFGEDQFLKYNMNNGGKKGFKLLGNTGFLCDNESITVAVIRHTIENTPCTRA